MLQAEHSAVLSIFIKLLFVIKIFVTSIFECPNYTGFTVTNSHQKYESVHEVAVLITMVTSEGTDYPAHLHSLAKAFIVHTHYEG